MAERDDVVVLNDIGLEQRTSSTGRQRSTVTIKAERLVHNFDPKLAGRPVADAIAGVLRMKIEQISTKASEATLRARAAALLAFNHAQAARKARNASKAAKKSKSSTGTKKATPARAPKAGPRMPAKYGPLRKDAADKLEQNAAERRYSGGRIGPMPPNQSDRMFNDSGRLAAGLVAAPKDEAYTINVAANRLTNDTGALEKIYEMLVRFVPEFANASLLMDNVTVRRAVQQSLQNMISKVEASNREKADQLAARVIGMGIRLLKAL